MNIRYTTTLLFLVLALTGCSPKEEAIQSGKINRTQDMSWGPIEMSITAEPAIINYNSDIIITIRIVSDKDIEVIVPDLEGRLNGFILSGEYVGEPTQIGKRIVIEKHARLTPLISDEYRIAPLAITYNDRRQTVLSSGWFATEPFVFETESQADNARDSINDRLKPLWIYPSGKEIAIFVLIIAVSVVVAWLLLRLLKGLHREAQLRRMSPKERAMKELEILLAKHLPSKALFKEFYIELTMIVRRYIERKHEIHAPEQTTEEFLAAISSDSRFSQEVLHTLKEFLESADLVKFAAYHPEQGSVDGAIDTARTYISIDSREASSDV